MKDETLREIEAAARYDPLILALLARVETLEAACRLAEDALGREYSADDEETRGGVALRAVRAALGGAE